jgi:UDP-N-acetylmuramoyl-L-alanyl-D-glutamate--2,6-diaminopimelate ligase
MIEYATMKNLHDVLGVDLNQHLDKNIEISGICVDSRRVTPGNLFVALPSYRNSLAYNPNHIRQAIAKGAVAIGAHPDANDEIGSEVAFIPLKNPRADFSKIAARFYGKQPQTIVAVTGTNGKTSVTHFVYQLWCHLGFKSGVTGTLGTYGFDLPHIETHHTTPDSLGLHKILNESARHGITHFAMEASSHGLDQHRLDNVDLAAAAFTNLTHEHLDYHKSLELYLHTKLRLFREILPSHAPIVFNKDDPVSPSFHDFSNPKISFGTRDADIRLDKIESHLGGQKIHLNLFGKTYEVDLALIGSFQAMNIMAAIGLLHATKVSIEDIIPLLPKLVTVPGRMEQISRQVYVDYAHTPDALKTVLQEARKHTTGKVSVVFGCGGDRDRGKRSIMGEIARNFANRAYITDDNPRSEDPALIRDEIMVMCPDAQNCPDREDAIAKAISHLGTEDILIIAGKGHETGQIVGDKVTPFDDREIAHKYCK